MKRRGPRLAFAGLLAAATAIYLTGVTAGLVSDTWALLWRASRQSLLDVLGEYIPQVNAVWYRPTTDLLYWLFYRIFGLNPVPYHLVSLGLWLAAGVLLYLLARRFTGSPWAALLAPAIFFFAIQAHEVMWDVASLHFALAGPLIVGAVLAWASGRRWLALPILAVAITADEAGMLVVPLIGLWELAHAPRLLLRRPVVLPLAGAAAIFTVYVAARLAAGGFHAESIGPGSVVTCHTPQCLIVATTEYANRLVVRFDPLVAQLWDHGKRIAAGVALVALLLFLVLKPWTWRERASLVFSIGWIAISSAFFIAGLWPYVADRFFYIPVMGLGLFGASAVQNIRLVAPGWSDWRRPGTALLGFAGAAWLALGAVTLVDRGGRWVDAGQQALAIIRSLSPYVQAAAPRTVLAVQNVPHISDRPIPPGNTGPYVFHNGLPQAVDLLLGRADLFVVARTERISPGTPATWLRVEGTNVVPAPPPTPAPTS